ncbi:hypothetical protein V5F41_12570 [Xanthobacter autotrophicus]|uniref:hypothetical protein n=1 Tax=Xanthobacter autotrophicus TaxID=280 RepID=UPI00372A85A7
MPLPAEGHADTIGTIRALHRRRNLLMGQRKAQMLSLGAFIRTILGWHRDAPAAVRKEIEARAAEMIEAGRKEIAGKGNGSDDPAYAGLHSTILACLKGAEPLLREEEIATRAMEKLAKTLPVWPWAKEVKGMGARSLAVIVGEAGDLGSYDKGEAGVWKRLGLAVIDGRRQGNAGKGADAATWQRHGYSPMRRATMYVIGECLIKQKGHYREIYVARKAIEVARAEALGLRVLPAAKIKKGEADGCISQMHIHRRAQRYMEKRLLRHLLQAWRRADQAAPERAIAKAPAAEFHPGSAPADGEGQPSRASTKARRQSPSPTFHEAAE